MQKTKNNKQTKNQNQTYAIKKLLVSGLCFMAE